MIGLLDSNAITKIQALLLTALLVVAGVVGVVAYVLLGGQNQSTETIKIGICGDIDNVRGGRYLRGATLAAEQVNAEGGVLGRYFEIITEDDDSETEPYDIVVAQSALTKLIAVDQADFILQPGARAPTTYQDNCADHKVIFFYQGMQDELAQRVADDYERYKGFFRVGAGNLSSAVNGMADCVLTLRNYTGFSKVAYLALDNPTLTGMASGMADSLREQGFDIVYENRFPPNTLDFSSYFAAVEASGAEILVPFFAGTLGAPFVREYHTRQSPFVVWGVLADIQEPDAWEQTDGKCEFVSFVGYPIVSGYPLTSKTLPTREAFIERWGDIPETTTAAAYDLVRFILPDAIRRAGSIEYEAMIKALEATDVETSRARHWVFTSAHDVMVGGGGPNNPAEDYLVVCLFQWQDGVQVPVYPKGLLEEAGATYKFPPWTGPWN